ncbi:GDSL-type esterase/lipase family protein [Pedobacter frigoris]|uniref:G-D-S-L family lipolytic protein n=1 Tax=Pedobacter frigoris TaxID=2571272 RepID=A0A4U1CE92_9SPHI|nr:GDSL-type esterase/lipase family protein [Pedobacter frigoris]TKC03657.1 G-D-S-L family lipolytic protein [Pedobacter frigoris]
MMKYFCLLFFLATSVFAQEYNPKTFEKEIGSFDQKDALEGAKSGSNLFVGSSTLRMWPDMQSYFPKAYVINRGFGGSKFEDLLYYTDRAITPYKPAKIFIYGGDNDIAAGIATDVILEQAKQLREKIRAALPGVPVVFIGAKPSVARWHLKNKYEEFNKALKAYSKKSRKTQFVDMWNPMLDKDGMVYKDIFLQDNLHMKAEGYKIWQKFLTPYLINNNFPK